MLRKLTFLVAASCLPQLAARAGDAASAGSALEAARDQGYSVRAQWHYLNGNSFSINEIDMG